jgi:hypothetical protein
MRKTIWAGTFAVVALATGREARAAGWGLHNGDTLNRGDNMIYAEAGWPDVSLGFQHGMTDMVDLGFRFSAIYGAEYGTGVRPGVGMVVPIRIAPVKRDRVSLLIHFDPGVKFDGFRPIDFGLWFPVGLEVGIHLTREATLALGMELPFYVNLTNGTYGIIPLLFGPAFEYNIDDHIAVGINAKFGPVIGPHVNARADVWFGFITQGFFAYRL